eukprot:m.11736 g.11736  ORF g.11736 m.11736 type:complete len:51 (-) comp4510_c0_seq2:1261-1413(-)
MKRDWQTPNETQIDNFCGLSGKLWTPKMCKKLCEADTRGALSRRSTKQLF